MSGCTLKPTSLKPCISYAVLILWKVSLQVAAYQAGLAAVLLQRVADLRVVLELAQQLLAPLCVPAHQVEEVEGRTEVVQSPRHTMGCQGDRE